MPYKIATDSHTDIPYTLVDKWQLPLVFMPYTLNSVEYFADMGRNGDYKRIFEAMAAGATATTSQLPQATYCEFLEPFMERGEDVLFIAFSSALSKTIDNLRAAAAELLEKYAGRRIEIFDTKAMSMAHGLLVLHALQMQAEGAAMDEVLNWLEDNCLRAHGGFVVDDLKFLKRGGRISNTTAFFGTLLNIKPFLVISKDGTLKPIDKAKGRRRIIARLVNYVKANMENPAETTLALMHSESIEDARQVAEAMRAAIPDIKEILITPVGSVIGVHVGPGLIAACFLGKPRTV